MEGEGEKERNTYLHADFQRIARRDKKTFLSDQCKEIEENIRMGKKRNRLRNLGQGVWPSREGQEVHCVLSPFPWWSVL